MVEIELDSKVTVTVERGTEKPCQYIVYHDTEELVRYQTSADPRKAAGKIGLRNIIYRQVSGYDKDRVEALLSDGLARNATELAETLDQ